MNKIQIKNITKKYNNLTALDDVSFSFEFGKIYGLLGRNGAGKSTLINIIANRIFADEGMILVDDIPAKENMQVHEKVFCMSEADLYDKDLKIKEHFRWINRFYDCFDLNKALTIAKMFDLDINKKFRSLSKGYQSIFKLTAALSLNIPYVIFDEPVLGLDANHRELFYELLLQDFENNERTIIIATHLIEEVTNIIEILQIIEKAKVLHLALFDADYPYIVPLHYGYEYKEGILIFYMHCAKEGHKLDLIRSNPNVCIEVESDVELISGGDVACKYGSSFASVIGRGRAELIEDVQEKIRGLSLFMKNQTGREFNINEEMAATVEVIKVVISEFTAKSRSKA